MSVNAQGISGTKTGFTWSGAWIAAILLAMLFAVSLFAVNNGGGQVIDRAPASAGSVLGDQLSGGPSTIPRGAAHDGGARWQPIVVNGTVCHQCR
jgi:hypothetical protein